MARMWVSINQNVERHLKSVPPRNCLRLRYEDLCRNPGLALARLGLFLGIGPIELRHEFRPEAHHIGGNKMRYGFVGKIRMRTEWRDELPPEDQREVWRIAGTLAERYGYHVGSGASNGDAHHLPGATDRNLRQISQG